MEETEPIKWTSEERDRIVRAFELLIKMDKKQNPDNYKKGSETKVNT